MSFLPFFKLKKHFLNKWGNKPVRTNTGCPRVKFLYICTDVSTLALSFFQRIIKIIIECSQKACH